MKPLAGSQIYSKISDLRNDPKVIIGIIVFFVLLDVAFVLRGQFVSVGKLFSQAKTFKNAIATAKRDSDSFPNYKKRVADLTQELTLLDKKIVNEGDLPSILEMISKYGDSSVIRILKIMPIIDPKRILADDKSEFFRQKISITIKSGFHQLGRFVALLENAPIYFDIKSMEIRGDAAEYAKQDVTIVLEVVLRKI